MQRRSTIRQTNARQTGRQTNKKISDPRKLRDASFIDMAAQRVYDYLQDSDFQNCPSLALIKKGPEKKTILGII